MFRRLTPTLTYLLSCVALAIAGPVMAQEADDTLAGATYTLTGGSGSIGCLTGNPNFPRDEFDYYKTLLPSEGSVKLSYTATSKEPTSSGNIIFTSFWQSNVQTSRVDVSLQALGSGSGEITVYSQAPDTLYFAVRSTYCADYTFAFDVIAPGEPADPEPNNTTGTAIAIAEGELRTGRVGYRSYRALDNVDWYVTKLPSDGTVKGYIEYTAYDLSVATSQVSFNAIQPRSVGFEGRSTAQVPAGMKLRDTLIADCQGADSLYFQIDGGPGMGYTFHYEIERPREAADREPNNTAAQADSLPLNTPVEGRLGFRTYIGVDVTDVYNFTTPPSGTYTVYVQHSSYKLAGQVSTPRLSVVEIGAAGPVGSISKTVAAGTTLFDTLVIKGRPAGTPALVSLTGDCTGYRVLVVEGDGTSGLSRVAPVEGLHVFPNPVTAGRVRIAAISSLTGAKLALVDVLGRTVRTATLEANGAQGWMEVSTAGLNPGPYRVLVHTVDGRQSQLLLVVLE